MDRPSLADRAAEIIERKKAATFLQLQNWAGELESYAKQNKTWNDNTGHATQGIHGGVDRLDDEFRLYLAHTMKHGQYLEEGTGLYGPHKQTFEIRPKTKKALSWDGAPHPVKKVTHPGMKAQPIIIPTIDAHIERIRQTLRELWED